MGKERRDVDVEKRVVDHSNFARKRQKRAREKNAQAEHALLALGSQFDRIVDHIVMLAAMYETPENNLGPRMVFMIELMKADAKERLGLRPVKGN
jgi:hypothetical protein